MRLTQKVFNILWDFEVVLSEIGEPRLNATWISLVIARCLLVRRLFFFQSLSNISPSARELSHVARFFVYDKSGRCNPCRFLPLSGEDGERMDFHYNEFRCTIELTVDWPPFRREIYTVFLYTFNEIPVRGMLVLVFQWLSR